MENFGKRPCFKHLKRFFTQMRNFGLQSHPVAKSARQSSLCFSIPRGKNSNLSNRGRSSGNKSETLCCFDRIGCSNSASPFCPVGFFNFSKNPGGREAGETSLDLEMGRNWSHTQHTTSGAFNAAWNKRIILSSSSADFTLGLFTSRIELFKFCVCVQQWISFCLFTEK